jgi:hypothetical protein
LGCREQDDKESQQQREEIGVGNQPSIVIHRSGVLPLVDH